VILTYLNTYIINKDHDLKVYQSKNKIGLNIDSFVNTFNFNNTVMKEKTALFITYIEFFHKLHTKYLKRFTMKLQLMLSQINNDIKLDNPNDTKTQKKTVLNDLKENNIDKHILRQLKISVSDENSVISSDPKTPPEIRSASTSEASDSSSEYMNVPLNTPETSEYVESNIIYEHVSELTDDNKCETQTLPKFTLSYIHSIKEENMVTDDISDIDDVNNGEHEDEHEDEDESEDDMHEFTITNTNEVIISNQCENGNNSNNSNNKKKKKKKKKRKSGNNSVPNISI
jgi:hypothetical protein